MKERAAKRRKTVSRLPKTTRTPLGKEGATAAQRRCRDEFQRRRGVGCAASGHLARSRILVTPTLTRVITVPTYLFFNRRLRSERRRTAAHRGCDNEHDLKGCRFRGLEVDAVGRCKRDEERSRHADPAFAAQQNLWRADDVRQGLSSVKPEPGQSASPIFVSSQVLNPTVYAGRRHPPRNRAKRSRASATDCKSGCGSGQLEVNRSYAARASGARFARS
jgi:hypothetical protein